MRILLVQPPFDTYEPVLTESLGLGYIAAALRAGGNDVEILDAQLRHLKPRDAVREILTREFDCLGITAAHAHTRSAIYIARAVRKERDDAIILAGGYLATLSTRQFLTACPEIDLVIMGEGESSASELFGRLSRGENWRDSPGVAFMKGETLVCNPPPPLIRDLDSVPFPARDALKQSAESTSALIAGGRGCYHRCSFCCIQSFYGVHGRHMPRARSAKNVADEIESVMDATGITKFGFVDDDFVGVGAKARERAVTIADEFRARKLDIDFSIECRADTIDEDLLKLLKEAGLTHVFLGVESGVQRQLDTYNKRITVEQNRKAIELVRNVGLRLTTGFILVDPYVTSEEILENVKFMKEMGLGESSTIAAEQYMMKLKLFHGLPLTEKLREDGLLKENGLFIDYAFKDKQFALVYRVMRAFGTCCKFAQDIKSLVTHKP